MILSFAWISGTAALAAALTSMRLGWREYFLQVFTLGSAVWLLWQLFLPELKRQEWHVAHECLFALLLTLYAVQGSTFTWWTPASLFALILSGLYINAQPLTDHCAYRGLITLDLALVVVLLTQRAPNRSQTHAVASLFLSLVAALNIAHHAAWELSVPIARLLGRSAGVLFAISMIAIAITAERERKRG